MGGLGVWRSLGEIPRALTVDNNSRGLILTLFHGFPSEDEMKPYVQSEVTMITPFYPLVHFKR